MSYSPTNWQSGDVVTSEKLNKLEKGVEDASEKELPNITGANEGQVLMAIGAKWLARDLPSDCVVQDTAEEDPDDPGTFRCNMSALDMYDDFHLIGVMINDSLVINATVVQDEVTGDNQYTFTVLSINNGTVSAITYTADNDDDTPHYTAS